MHAAVFTLRKASIVQAAQKMLTDRMAAQAMMPAQKRSSTIQINDRNIPAARPATPKCRVVDTAWQVSA